MADLSFINRLGRIGSLAGGYYQGQDERLRRQMLQNQFQQQLAQQQGQAALANALASPPPGQQPQGIPQPPNPGQQSQPQAGPPQGPQPGPPQGQPPQGPPPGGIPQPPRRMMGPPGDGMAPQQPQQPQQPPIRPYTAPQAPQAPQVPPGSQQAPGGGIPPPPQVTQAVQSTLPDLKTMADTLKKQGVTGMALFQALQQHQQFLSADGKAQLAQLTAEIRRISADAAAKRADTGARGEDRREATAEGGNAAGAAAIDKNRAAATELQARAARENRSGGIGSRSGGSGGAGKPGKPQVFTGEDGKRYSSILMPDGRIVTRDAMGRQVGPDGAPTPVSPGQQTMRNTVKLDISEIDQSMDAMKKAGPDATASIFFEDKDAGTLARWRNNTLTPEEYQQYDVYANRLAGAIAGIQSMGRGQVSDEKIRQARKLVPVPGNDPGTIKTKLQFIQGIRDRANKIMQGKSPDEIKEGEAALSPEDKAALDWANANPKDPRAARIKQHLGM